MRILVLGAAAGGGFPQWNANNPLCRRSREGDANTPAQTQSSIAVSAGGKDWFLMNASPDLRQQINDNRQLHPRNGVRHSPIAGVILTNADVDHIAGLLTLRERQPFTLYATERVLGTLKANSVFNVLNPEFVTRTAISLDAPFRPSTMNGDPQAIEITAFPVPGKVALYLEDPDSANFGTMEEDTIGLEICDTDTGRRAFYIPGCANVTDALKSRIDGADLLLFDGTLFTDDEMLRSGESVKTGARMGHISISGNTGSIAALSSVNVKRRVFIHINNTNPVLARDSEERRVVEAAGWEIAMDGMELNP